MTTIYNQERQSYSRTGWKNRKKQLRKHGLKPGEWYRLSYEGITLSTVRKGMYIQNKKGGPIYRVLEVGDKGITVVDVALLYTKEPWRYYKVLKRISLFRWIKRIG